MINRRSFIRGLGLLVAAPAIVRVSSLMAISPVPAAEVVLTHDGFAWVPMTATLEITEEPFDSMITDILRRHTEQIAHTISENNRLLLYLKDKGRIHG